MTTDHRAAHPRRSLLRRPRRRRHPRRTCATPACAREINEAFEEHGLLIFEDVEPTPEDAGGDQHRVRAAQGPPEPGGAPRRRRRHARRHRDAPRAERGRAPSGSTVGCCRSGCRGTSTTATTTSSTAPACCAPSRSRPTAGLTGFVDGIALYDAISPEVRDQIEGETVIYAMDVIMDNLRFGRPDGFVEVEPAASAIAVMAEYEGRPRALHPAVWTRRSGEKVLHVSPLDGEGHRGSRRRRRRRAARRGVRRDRRGGRGPQLLPSVAADRHGHLGQLAHASTRCRAWRPSTRGACTARPSRATTASAASKPHNRRTRSVRSRAPVVRARRRAPGGRRLRA